MSRSAVSVIMLSLFVIGMLAFAFRIQPARSSPATITVPDDYTTIQAAINAADLGDTVYVRAGTYVENVVINKTLSLVGEDAVTTTIDGGNVSDVVQIVADGINLTGFTVCESGLTSSAGIRLGNASYCGISGNNIRNNCEGVYLGAGQNNTLSGNNITANNSYAVHLVYSPYNFFSGNNIANNGRGFYVSFSYYNAFFGNSIKTNGGYGIALEGCHYSTLSGNIFVNDGLYVWGSYGSVVVDNLVNGKPLVYLESVSDSVVGDAGQVVLVNCNRIRVENLNLSAASMGVELWGTNNSELTGNNFTNSMYGIYSEYSFNNTVSGNNVANNWAGVGLAYSSNNTVSGNNVTANGWRGVSIWYSSDNTVSVNNVTNNEYGIFIESSSNNTVSRNNITDNLASVYLYSSSNNTVLGNNIVNNTYGVYLESSSDNLFFHNDFTANTQQAFLSALGYVNIWDDGYPGGGNSWSDYNGTDLFRGAYQNITGSDCIGDSSRIIDANNTDRYPLMGPYGCTVDTGSNVTLFPSQDLGLIFSNVTAAGDVVLNETLSVMAPALGNLTGEYYDVKVTASVSGKITIRIIYDASNMTQQQESNLQMMQYTPIPGDIRPAFGKVDMADIGYIARRFGTNATSPLWDPAADITGPTYLVPDGKIDMRDIGLVAKNFGKTSQWINITTYVDTTSHIIYGETTHFSLIGIH